MVTSSFGVTHHLWHLGPLQVTWDFKLVKMFLNYDLLLWAPAQWSVQIGPDWSRLVESGPDWSKAVQVGSGWSKSVQNGPEGSKWRIGPLWRISPNRSKRVLVKIKIETILEWALWVELTVWAHLQIEGDQLNRYYSLLFECSHL